LVSETVAKLVNTSTPTKEFFDGTTPAGSTNFLANPTAFNTLFNHLVEFFGSSGALDCTDDSIPDYSGNADMAAVHADMPIDNETFNFFNQQLYNVGQENGVEQTDLNSVAALLEGFRGTICNQADCGNPEPSSSGLYIIAPVVAIIASFLAVAF